MTTPLEAARRPDRESIPSQTQSGLVRDEPRFKTLETGQPGVLRLSGNACANPAETGAIPVWADCGAACVRVLRGRRLQATPLCRSASISRSHRRTRFQVNMLGDANCHSCFAATCAGFGRRDCGADSSHDLGDLLLLGTHDAEVEVRVHRCARHGGRVDVEAGRAHEVRVGNDIGGS